ncbi:protein O-mannosyl-transferase family [Candidatus Neomarinimicrobiota bacterium]
MNLDYKQTNWLVAALVTVISFIVYLATMAPAVSFWDCGEFIATSYTLGVTHPPGSPLYLLIGRIFTMLPLFKDIAARMNLISVLSSAAAVTFLYLSIVILMRKYRGPVESVQDAIISYGGAVIGSLAFAFSDSHWFNAVEAEVYAASTLLTALTVWIILRWSQKDDQSSHLHYILILAYLMGLATGIHMLNLLTLPFLAMVVYIRRREFTWPGLGVVIVITLATFLVIYQGMLKGLPKIAAGMSIPLAIVYVLAVVVIAIWAIHSRKEMTSIIFSSIVLIFIGYSTYITIFIRSGQNPQIDENDPENTTRALAYMEREQYGDWPIFDRARWKPEAQHKYSGTTDYAWNYQFRKMYVRYFLWQFAGRGPSENSTVTPFGADPIEDGVNWFQFGLPLALIFGIYGLWYHFKRDPHHALAVLSLFLATGLMIIIYLNQQDPQPRERDYAYVGSYWAFALWIGIGAAGFLEQAVRKLKAAYQRVALPGIAVVLLVAMPGVMLVANYHEHDRTGNYVAWDYSYNLLNSCDQDGILFTNGDNDTFPLWYLQEVEGIRKDVKIVNLSLLNTDWYIEQLRDNEPRLPLNLSDESIRQMRPIPWEAKELTLDVSTPEYPAAILKWTLRPTFGGRYLRTQDRMIVQLIKDIKWERPIYFAVTVAPTNRIGLEKYMEMQGLVHQVMPHTVSPINMAKLHHNLLENYRYRNLGDESVHFNNNISRLLQNLRASFLQLSVDAMINDDSAKALMYLDTLAVTIPETTIPVNNKGLYMQMTQLYANIGEKDELRKRLGEFTTKFKMDDNDWLSVGAAYIQYLNDFTMASPMLDAVYERNPDQGQIIGSLVQLYRQAGRPDKAIPILTRWIEQNPGDVTAKSILESLAGAELED